MLKQTILKFFNGLLHSKFGSIQIMEIDSFVFRHKRVESEEEFWQSMHGCIFRADIDDIGIGDGFLSNLLLGKSYFFDVFSCEGRELDTTSNIGLEELKAVEMIVFEERTFTCEKVIDQNKELTSEILVDKVWFYFLKVGNLGQLFEMGFKIHIGRVPGDIEMVMIERASVG